MTSADAPTPPPCPEWCTETHDAQPDRIHRREVAAMPVEPEDPGAADLLTVTLEAFEHLEDPEHNTPPELWLSITGPTRGGTPERIIHEMVKVTPAGLAGLVTRLGAGLSTPALARLAIPGAGGGEGASSDVLNTLEEDELWAEDDAIDLDAPASTTAGSLPRPSRPAGPAPTMETWRRHQVAEGYSDLTIRVRRTAVTVIATAAGVEPHALTSEHVVDYLSTHPLAVNSRLKYLQHVKAWAQFAGIDDPTQGIRRPSAPKGRPRPISDHDLGKLLELAAGRVRLFVMLGAYAGFRSFETAKFALEDLEPVGAGDEWRLRVLGKGGRADVIPCNPILASEIIDYARHRGIAGGRLFPKATPASVQKAIRDLGGQCGVTLTSHQLRHWYGTSVHVASGGDILVTQQLMRHSNPSTTAGYAAVAGYGLRSAVTALGATSDAGGRPFSGGLRVLQGGIA